jgi:hypothetical protein
MVLEIVSWAEPERSRLSAYSHVIAGIETRRMGRAVARLLPDNRCEPMCDASKVKIIRALAPLPLAAVFVFSGTVGGPGASDAKAASFGSRNAVRLGVGGLSSRMIIHRDHSIGILKIPGGRIGTALRLFGEKRSIRRLGLGGINLDTYFCRVSWPIGVSVEFSSSTDESCSNGYADEATVTGYRFRTEKGLRIGSSITKLRKLYPHAYSERIRGGAGYVLLSRNCQEGGPGSPQPTLFARVWRGRVRSLLMSPPACE